MLVFLSRAPQSILAFYPNCYLKKNTMRTAIYICTLLFMTSNFLSCTPDAITDESNIIEHASDLGSDQNDPEDDGE